MRSVNAEGSTRSGSNTTVARAAARLTSARSTPSSLPSPRPIRVAQAAQVIPSTGRSMRWVVAPVLPLMS